MKSKHRLAIFTTAALLLAAVWLHSHRVYALIGAHFSYGFAQKATLEVEQEYWKNLEKGEVSASFGKVSIFANPPIPTPFVDIAVGIGAGFEYFDLGSAASFKLQVEGEEASGKLQSISSPFLGPEVAIELAIPAVPVNPRARLLYAFALPSLKGEYTHQKKTSPVKIPLTARGLRYAVGLSYSPIPLLTLYVEHEWARNTLGLSSVLDEVKNTVADVDEKLREVVDDVAVEELSGTIHRQGFIVGIQAGI